MALAVSLPTFAVTTQYTNSVTFMAALQAGAYTESFTTASAGVFNAPIAFSTGGFSYQVSTPTVAVGVYRSGAFIGNTYEAESMTITLTGGGATGIGGNFYVTNQSDVFQAAAVVLTLSDGTTATFTPTSATAGSYAGFTSTTPITSLVILGPALGQFNAMDNLTVGLALPVPEAARWHSWRWVWRAWPRGAGWSAEPGSPVTVPHASGGDIRA